MKRISSQSKRLSLLPFVVFFCACSSSGVAPISSLEPDYDLLSRGSYRGSYYKVAKGDTLYFIAYITDKDVKEIITSNHLEPPYTIHPGQKLNIWKDTYISPSYGQKGTRSQAKKPTDSSRLSSSTPSVTPPLLSQEKAEPTSQNKKAVEYKKPKEYSPTVSTNKPKVDSSVKAKAKNSTWVSWLWPSNGRVISAFSSAELGNKGIDIAGRLGQNITASADGKVVYAGNALRGYGNLIIIKHNEDFLSAYAHNDRILVSEAQSVKKGQNIALMGRSGANSVRLHFEIRYKGKSVDPLRYLPKR